MKEHKKFERLMLFSEVAQQLSFTTAAKKLKISRGHLSTQISLLEKEMAVVLFIRSTRSVRLTQEGQRVLEGMKKVHMTLLEIDRNSAIGCSPVEGLIKITAPVLFSQAFLLDIMTLFRKQYPKVTFFVDSSYNRFDLLENDFDLAFRSTKQPPENMIAKKLLSYKRKCYASPSYLNREGYPQTPENLSEHHCLSDKGRTYWSFDHMEVPINSWLEMNDNVQLKSMAILGQGIINIAEYAVSKETKDKQLVPVLEQYNSDSHSLYLLHPHLAHRPNRISRFIQFVQEYLAKVYTSN
ncbi:LysR family transcriptional regulator [Photobacterium minamisatsumaniensis]|uniref:LysR family transcriptional regulator n=1 Tax=Photobacterium minamisatsumaniensis TaxID=2910233 RepID=UPI003D0CF7CE